MDRFVKWLSIAYIYFKRVPIIKIFLKNYKIGHKYNFFNSKIHIFWSQGENNAPKLIKVCIESWRVLNPDCEVIVWDQDTANELLPRSAFNDISHAHYSDMLRTKILYDYGGIWADATCICIKNITSLANMALSQSSLFMFSRPSDEQLISNWFIISTPKNDFLLLWHHFQTYVWKLNLPKLPYFTSHYIFSFLCLINKSFKREYNSMLNLCAYPPHRAQFCIRNNDFSEKELMIIKSTFVQKLTYKIDFDIIEIKEKLCL